MLDPGNNNGAASSQPAGPTPTFANGTNGDITLATGSLVSGHFTGFATPNPLNIRSIGDFVQTFRPAAGEGGFFMTPVSPYEMIQLFDTTYLQDIVITGIPTTSDPSLSFSVLNGEPNSAVMGLLVPEPTSFLLLGGGLISLTVLRRRRPQH
jgi:hypothetical protein